jgi:hypothetical protein
VVIGVGLAECRPGPVLALLAPGPVPAEAASPAAQMPAGLLGLARFTEDVNEPMLGGLDVGDSSGVPLRPRALAFRCCCLQAKDTPVCNLSIRIDDIDEDTAQLF